MDCPVGKQEVFDCNVCPYGKQGFCDHPYLNGLTLEGIEEITNKPQPIGAEKE